MDADWDEVSLPHDLRRTLEMRSRWHRVALRAPLTDHGLKGAQTHWRKKTLKSEC